MGHSRAGTRSGTTLGDAIGPGSGAAPSPSGNGQIGPMPPGMSRRAHPDAKERRRRRRRSFLLVCAILLAALILGMILGALSGII